jgi:hypothetical protein
MEKLIIIQPVCNFYFIMCLYDYEDIQSGIRLKSL